MGHAVPPPERWPLGREDVLVVEGQLLREIDWAVRRARSIPLSPCAQFRPSDFTVSRIPAVSPLGVLCKTHLIALVKAFSALLLSLSASAQRAPVALKCGGAQTVRTAHRAPGGIRATPHEPPGLPAPVQLRACHPTARLTCAPTVTVVRHATPAGLERISDLLERAPWRQRPRRAHARRLLPALTGLPALPRGPDRAVRRRPSRRRRLRAAPGHLAVRAAPRRCSSRGRAPAAAVATGPRSSRKVTLPDLGPGHWWSSSSAIVRVEPSAGSPTLAPAAELTPRPGRRHTGTTTSPSSPGCTAEGPEAAVGAPRPDQGLCSPGAADNVHYVKLTHESTGGRSEAASASDASAATTAKRSCRSGVEGERPSARAGPGAAGAGTSHEVQDRPASSVRPVSRPWTMRPRASRCRGEDPARSSACSATVDRALGSETGTVCGDPSDRCSARLGPRVGAHVRESRARHGSRGRSDDRSVPEAPKRA